MPKTLTPTPTALGPIAVPVAGDPRNAGSSVDDPIQQLLNMLAGVQQNTAPTGLIQQFAGSVAPTGWLLCDGRALSRTDYVGLFAVIGTTYGTGNNSTTFNLPDLRGRFPVGAGQGVGLTNRPLAGTGGEESHGLTIQEMPKHAHQAPTAPSAQAASGSTYEVAAASGYGGGYNSYDYQGAAPTDQAGGDAQHNNMPPYLAVTYIIRS